MIPTRKAALYALPLVLAPPMATVGQFGITLPEVMVVYAGFMILLLGREGRQGTPPFMLMFLLLFCMGWIGSLYNAYEWHIPVSLGNVVFLYTPLLAWTGFVVGNYSALSLNDIVTSTYTRVIIISVAVFAAAYPFLSPGTRQLIMTPFINELFHSRLASPRFPGIGINANVYSFMVYVFGIFSLHAYLRGRGAAAIPFAAIVIIVAAAGRTITVLMLASVLVLVGAAAFRSGRQTFDRIRAATTRRRAFGIGLVIIALTAVAIAYGAQARDAFSLYVRFQDMLSDSEYGGLRTRTDVWAIGLERLKLSPVLGIPRDPGRVDDSNPLYYYTPHNEFISLWTLFGVLALIAHVFLILRMIIMNLRYKAELPWLLLYGAMIVQMMVDSVFGGPRATAFFFMIIGLNTLYLRELKAARVMSRPKPLEPVLA